MKFKTLTYASIATCFLSFLSLLFCSLLSPIDEKMKEWLLTSFLSFIISLISARFLRQNDEYVREESKTTIGESNFEVTIVALILWLPVILTTFAIIGIIFMKLSFEKFGWILVVLAGSTGFQIARLPCFSHKN